MITTHAPKKYWAMFKTRLLNSFAYVVLALGLLALALFTFRRALRDSEPNFKGARK